MNERRNLSDILRGADRDDLTRAWDETQAAADLAAVPKGEYVALIMSGELVTSRTNSTPGYKLTFQVAEGDFIGRRFWYDLWLTKAALPMTKRDLAKLGVNNLDKLERPLPPGIRCRVRLALERDDDGTERNRVKSFSVIGIDPPDPFAPTEEDPGGDGGDGHAAKGDAYEHPADRLFVTPGENGQGLYGPEGGRR
jgi:hypothetical protein